MRKLVVLVTILILGVSIMAEVLPKITTSHPRLFLENEGLQRLKTNYKTTYGKALGDRVIFDAEELLTRPLLKRIKTGRRLLSVSREAIFRVSTLSVAYFLSADRRFLERAVEEMKTICAFKDWNPSHYLDVAEMTFAVSLGYDWLYNDMSEADRNTILEGLLKHGPQTGLVNNCGLRDYENNWAQVCNAGMVIGSVVSDDYDLQQKYGAWTIDKVAKIMDISYSPNGSYPEGSSYWAYGTEYNALLLMALKSVYGTEFGLADIAGFSKTGDYMNAMAGDSNESANFNDSGRNYSISFAMFYLAERFNREDFFNAAFCKIFNDYISNRAKNRSKNRFMALAMLYIDRYKEPQESKIVDELYFSGESAISPIAVYRKKLDEQRLYLAIKAGSPDLSHAHMDQGSFVIEFNGVRFSDDLGMEPYNNLEQLGIGLWDRAQNGDRWQIFKLGSESHNIIRINGEDLLVKGTAKFTTVEPNHTVLDLSSMYKDGRKVKRTFAIESVDKVVITDSFANLKEGDIISFQFISDAKVVENNSGVLILKKSGEKVKISTPSQTPWLVEEVNTLLKPYELKLNGYYRYSMTYTVKEKELAIKTIIESIAN